MSRKLLAFLLSELSIVRVKCLKCNKVAELNYSDLGKQFEEQRCPFCKAEFTMLAQANNPFLHLSKSIEVLKDHSEAVEIEFVLPDND